jgi:hypothetical protein
MEVNFRLVKRPLSSTANQKYDLSLNCLDV